MGITRIGHQGPRKDNNALNCSLTFDDFVHEEKLLFLEDHVAELDDSEPSDAGCEHALVDESICDVPYELFELPNLKEILSLQTWNLYLTDEERFHLTAYLPDMDQEAFYLTMSELLGGSNIFFGSPLEIFFHRLRGGFYSVQVSQFREGLNVLYKRLYYHSLRSYHERMAEKIIKMRKALSNYQPNTSVEERVRNLTNMHGRKPALLVDLNAVPDDEDDEAQTHVPAMDWDDEVSNRAKAKGVLKIKPLEMNSTSKLHALPPFYTESRESFKRPPKGVLKIKPKGYATNLVESSDSVFVIRSSSQFDVHRTMMKRVRSDFGECFGCQQSKAPSPSSAGLSQSVPDDHRRKMMSEAVSRNSTLMADDYQLFSRYCDRMFPITYRRRKLHSNLGAVHNLRTPLIVAGMELLEPSEAGLHQVERAKSMEMRVKGWNEFTFL